MRLHRLFLALPLAMVLVAGGVRVSTAPAGQAAAALADGIALVKPESVGFASEMLKELDPAMQGVVDNKQLAGVVTLVARHGKVVQHKAYGVQGIPSQTPMTLDSIVRVYSKTKPIADTWFFNDPVNDLLFIGVIQRRGGCGEPRGSGARGRLQGARRPVQVEFTPLHHS